MFLPQLLSRSVFTTEQEESIAGSGPKPFLLVDLSRSSLKVTNPKMLHNSFQKKKDSWKWIAMCVCLGKWAFHFFFYLPQCHYSFIMDTFLVLVKIDTTHHSQPSTG